MSQYHKATQRINREIKEPIKKPIQLTDGLSLHEQYRKFKNKMCFNALNLRLVFMRFFGTPKTKNSYI